MKQTKSDTGYPQDAQSWARKQFGSCELGDERRTKRLVNYASRQVRAPEASTHAVCDGSDAVAEGTYRWLRNEAISADAVMEGPIQATVEECRGRDILLAIQDTSTFVFSHAVAEKLGSVGEVGGNSVRGILVHSTLMVDAQTREPIGLVDQQRWTRSDKTIKESHKKRSYQDKESIKWKQATEQMHARFGDVSNIVTVCDREADIYEYLTYLMDNEQRFVVRAGQNRRLQTRCGNLVELMSKQRVVGSRRVEMAQRGAQRGSPKQKKRKTRPARTATMSIRTAEVELSRPANQHHGPLSVSVGVVYLREKHPCKGEQRAEWILLTTEPLCSTDAIDRVIGYYEGRWLIEEFHKAWKTGCRVEQRRLQSLGNLQRLMAVTAPIAVRILQLRTLAQANPKASCTQRLSDDQWRCLFAKVEPQRPIPKKPPSLEAVLFAIAKLGGWRDTKQNRRIGWQALWRGWTKLEMLVEGWQLAQQLQTIELQTL